MSYIETLTHEYAWLDLTGVRLRLPLAAGLTLLEARSCRLAPDHTVSYVERAIIKARQEVRRWYEERCEIVPTPPRNGR